MFILDTSVIIKALTGEEGCDQALELCVSSDAAVADLAAFEVAGALARLCAQGRLPVGELASCWDDWISLQLPEHPARPHLGKALEIAGPLRQSAYDCIHLVTALHTGCRLITADARFFRALQKSEYAGTIELL